VALDVGKIRLRHGGEQLDDAEAAIFTNKG